MHNFIFLFYYFISYSVLGWLVECLYCSFREKRMCFDRGFLIGPYCPIYGSCAVFMMLSLKRYLNDPIALFLFAMVLASLFEYFTSLIMEKIFKARWWDYTTMPFNINGRICLPMAVGFGFLGIFFMYFVHPFYSNITSSINYQFLTIITAILFVLFVFDCIVSFTVITKLRSSLLSLKGDSTYTIDKEVKKFLKKNSYLVSRLLKVFPTVKIALPSGDKIIKSLKNSISSLEKEDQKLKEKIMNLEKRIEKITKSGRFNVKKRIARVKKKIEKLKNKINY